MIDENLETLERVTPLAGLDIGRPVAWMVDPNRREEILGVTYEFSRTGERKTVWYTPNKRKPKVFVTVSEPPKG
jgi:hypothetical protein